MKGIVIYHSITGNTKKIAQAIYAGMRQTGEACSIAKIKDITLQDLSSYDLIGLGSPVMYFRELHNVTNFIESMRNVEGKHSFAFCTHGTIPGGYFARTVPAMTQRGLTVIGWNDWFGNVYFPCIPKPYFTDGHPDDIDLEEAEEFGRAMMERSRRIHKGETQLIPTLPRGKEYDEMYNPLMAQRQSENKVPDLKQLEENKERQKKFTNTLSLEFKVNKQKCHYPKCTMCVDNCPMNAIDFSISPPMFNKDCDRCFLCEMACPWGAIEYDFEPLQKMHEVKPGESMLQKSLEIFEARGRFRRLVPLDKIGWDNTLYKIKKPRYKIA